MGPCIELLLLHFNKIIAYALTVIAAQSFLGVTPSVFLQYSSLISSVNGRDGNISVTLVLPPGKTISVQAFKVK